VKEHKKKPEASHHWGRILPKQTDTRVSQDRERSTKKDQQGLQVQFKIVTDTVAWLHGNQKEQKDRQKQSQKTKMGNQNQEKNSITKKSHGKENHREKHPEKKPRGNIQTRPQKSLAPNQSSTGRRKTKEKAIQ